jgi:tRNA(fMet)-specific endonuclease VapC
MNKRPESVIQKFRQFEPGEIGISSISVSELQYGVAKSANPQRNQQRLYEFFIPFEILPYDESASQAYADIRFQLEKKDKTVGALDMLIGAQALSLGLILMTNNEKEFRRIPGLKIENWAGQ